MFGGYEYTPEGMGQRTDVMLRDKHNEALRVMPVIFSENGYEVTVCDPPFANYQFIPDLSIYDDHPEIRTFNTEGQFNDEREESIEERKHIRERNLFCYSLCRISPVLIQSELYDDGNYNKTDRLTGDKGAYYQFMRSYNVLNSLSQTTLIQEDGQNTFFMINNHTTHEPITLQKPAYEPVFHDINNKEFDREHSTVTAEDGRVLDLNNTWRETSYDVNMAALILLGKWMDYLKEQGVYDNTRIIIAADHGVHLDNPEFVAPNLRTALDPIYKNILYFNPLYMVKDFGSEGPLRTSEEFMTNADTPTIAFTGLIENPINPATGQVITNEDKQGDVQIVYSTYWDLLLNYGCVYNDPHIYEVKTENILNPENWTQIN